MHTLNKIRHTIHSKPLAHKPVALLLIALFLQSPNVEWRSVNTLENESLEIFDEKYSKENHEMTSPIVSHSLEWGSDELIEKLKQFTYWHKDGTYIFTLPIDWESHQITISDWWRRVEFDSYAYELYTETFWWMKVKIQSIQWTDVGRKISVKALLMTKESLIPYAWVEKIVKDMREWKGKTGIPKKTGENSWESWEAEEKMVSYFRLIEE